MYQLPYTDHEERKSFSTKCNVCKKPTEQEFIKITPLVETEADPMELLKLTKRLIICTECGTLRLIN